MLPRLLLQGAASVERRPSAPERTGGGRPRTWSHRGAQFLGAAGRRADASRSRRAVRHAYLRRRSRRTTLLFSSVSACACCLFVSPAHCRYVALPFFLFLHWGLAGTQAYALTSPPAHVLFFFFLTFSLSLSPSPANLRCSLPNSTATCGDACTTQPAPGIRTPFCGSNGEGDGCDAHPECAAVIPPDPICGVAAVEATKSMQLVYTASRG